MDAVSKAELGRNQTKTLLGIETLFPVSSWAVQDCRNQTKTLLGIETKASLNSKIAAVAAIKLKPY